MVIVQDERGNYQNCSLLCWQFLCTTISTHMSSSWKCWFRFILSFYLGLPFCVFLVWIRLSCSCVVCFCCVRLSFFSSLLRQEIIAGKNVSEMTYFVSSGMQNLNSINLLTCLMNCWSRASSVRSPSESSLTKTKTVEATLTRMQARKPRQT